MPHKFLTQPHTAPDSKLCAFYALYHFTDGQVSRQAFIDAATNHYMTSLGMNKTDAQAMVMDGNDPSVLSLYHLRQTDEKTLQTAGVGIIANVATGHFFTVRQEGGAWVSYDSYNHQAPVSYASFAALKQAEIANGAQIWTA